MSSLLKSTALSLVLVAGVTAAAYAQSVSALPPAGGMTTTAPPPVTSSAKIFPNPGAGSTWQEQHTQSTADYSADKSQHPYSTSIGPNPGSHSSGKEPGYMPTEADSTPALHPYTAGVGPKPN